MFEIMCTQATKIRIRPGSSRIGEGVFHSERSKISLGLSSLIDSVEGEVSVRFGLNMIRR